MSSRPYKLQRPEEVGYDTPFWSFRDTGNPIWSQEPMMRKTTYAHSPLRRSKRPKSASLNFSRLRALSPSSKWDLLANLPKIIVLCFLFGCAIITGFVFLPPRFMSQVSLDILCQFPGRDYIGAACATQYLTTSPTVETIQNLSSEPSYMDNLLQANHQLCNLIDNPVMEELPNLMKKSEMAVHELLWKIEYSNISSPLGADMRNYVDDFATGRKKFRFFNVHFEGTIKLVFTHTEWTLYQLDLALRRPVLQDRFHRINGFLTWLQGHLPMQNSPKVEADPNSISFKFYIKMIQSFVLDKFLQASDLLDMFETIDQQRTKLRAFDDVQIIDRHSVTNQKWNILGRLRNSFGAGDSHKWTKLKNNEALQQVERDISSAKYELRRLLNRLRPFMHNVSLLRLRLKHHDDQLEAGDWPQPLREDDFRKEAMVLRACWQLNQMVKDKT